MFQPRRPTTDYEGGTLVQVMSGGFGGSAMSGRRVLDGRVSKLQTCLFMCLREHSAAGCRRLAGSAERAGVKLDVDMSAQGHVLGAFPYITPSAGALAPQ